MSFSPLSAEQLRSTSRRAFLRHARDLLREIEKVDFSLPMQGANEAVRTQLRASAFMNACVEAQAGSAHMPEIVVITGSAGVGKSSLFNALARTSISPSSSIRPCTKQGVALVHPADEAAFAAHPVSRWVRTVAHPYATRGIALIDSPPSDWAQPELYEKAQCLLDMASRVIFVTTMYRYGDGAAWDMLSRLHSRGVECAAVMNRVTPEADGTAQQDFLRLWRAAGLSSARIAMLYEGDVGECTREAQKHVEKRREEHTQENRRHEERRQESCSLPQTQEAVNQADTSVRQRKRIRSEQSTGITEQNPSAAQRMRCGIVEIQRWIDMAARGWHSRARTQRPHDYYEDLRKDVTLVADSLDITRHALIDLCDRAREGAAAPFDKLMTNVQMGRFGQGSPQTIWQGLASEGGALSSLKNHGDLGVRARAAEACTAELSALLETVTACVQVALLQGLETAMLNIENMWAHDPLDTSDYVKAARNRINKEEIAREALEKWHQDLLEIARKSLAGNASGRLRLSNEGLIGLIGVAASGVSGAAQLAREAGLEESIWAARSELGQRIRKAVDKLTSIYTSEIRALHVPDSSALRARLDEFLCVVYADPALSGAAQSSRFSSTPSKSRSKE